MDDEYICETCVVCYNFNDSSVNYCYRCGEIYCTTCFVRNYIFNQYEDPDIVMEFCTHACFEQFMFDDADEWAFDKGG